MKNFMLSGGEKTKPIQSQRKPISAGLADRPGKLGLKRESAR